MPELPPLGQDVLPAGITARHVDNVAGLRMHILEAGDPAHPCLLLLHGFPELAFSWRQVMVPLAEHGYHVVAPDQRGYGRTTGAATDYDAPLIEFQLQNLVRDMLILLHRLGHAEAAAVIGHDFGASVAAWAALIRPDIFRRLVLMSAPFAGPPPLDRAPAPDIDLALSRLPRPRKHYQHYYSTRQANADMWHPPQGMHAFLRAYFHQKSADWQGNTPHRLASWTAEELAKLPTYYVMDRTQTMPRTVAPHTPGKEAPWLTDRDLAVYAQEYERTGFQPALQWYRCRYDADSLAALRLWSGRIIDIPSLFIAGQSDWGVYQVPGAVEAMQDKACTKMADVHLVEGAGHWVQQEQAREVLERVGPFIGQ